MQKPVCPISSVYVYTRSNVDKEFHEVVSPYVGDLES